MQIRKDLLVTNHLYHIYSRSIAGYKIFNTHSDFERLYQLLKLYRYANFEFKYSHFLHLDDGIQNNILNTLYEDKDLLVDIIAFCFMPTHIHIILKQMKKDGISKFMARVLNGYSRYFNVNHKRNGPLWSGRFKSVLIKNDDQLLHLTRYLHLNPTSIGLVKDPNEWEYSSYNDYISKEPNYNTIINIDGLFDFTSKTYQKFVLDRKSYQRDLALIKSLLIDEYSG